MRVDGFVEFKTDVLLYACRGYIAKREADRKEIRDKEIEFLTTRETKFWPRRHYTLAEAEKICDTPRDHGPYLKIYVRGTYWEAKIKDLLLSIQFALDSGQHHVLVSLDLVRELRS